MSRRDGGAEGREVVGIDEGGELEWVLVDWFLVEGGVELFAEGFESGEDLRLLSGEEGCCC